MKKKFNLIAIIISLVLLEGCVSNNSGDEKSMNINIDGIEQITISTQVTDPKQDYVLEDEEIKVVLDKLNSYSLKEITDEKEAGWQYLIKIEKKGGDITLISFMDNKVKVNDILYEVRDYNVNDFLYLFDSTVD